MINDSPFSYTKRKRIISRIKIKFSQVRPMKSKNPMRQKSDRIKSKRRRIKKSRRQDRKNGRYWIGLIVSVRPPFVKLSRKRSRKIQWWRVSLVRSKEIPMRRSWEKTISSNPLVAYWRPPWSRDISNRQNKIPRKERFYPRKIGYRPHIISKIK